MGAEPLPGGGVVLAEEQDDRLPSLETGVQIWGSAAAIQLTALVALLGRTVRRI
ncbi:hypothetical protein [Candidatus Nephthysia bennettiae]|uniref:Uncharacterized protein n=1 Tax=Candidatus Nephthysia bennettiae TaxID=3127016 RepID=A0A934N9Z5_9BACT|nr:hypothetical protein [Candidatus Dormibacteraeota bacterium]MBJ7613474.1 hypothetical protein [Candidatus Dormibacteraeota bacterium]